MRSRLLTAICLAAACSVAAPAWAKKIKITPAKAKQLKKVRKSFEACRKDALAQFKAKSIDQISFDRVLATCNEHFPGASLYINCKKAAIKSAAAQRQSAKAEVAQCKRLLVAASFDPEQPLPVYVDHDQLYFAGIGLNQSQPLKRLKPPNFDCEALATAADKPLTAQYILFGNHPKLFAGLNALNKSALAKALKFNKPKAKGVDLPGFGRLFGDPKSAAATVYFPSAACSLDTDLGETFAGISAYYLLDGAGGTATPYFGIAYFKQDQQAITTDKLVQGLLKQLGPAYKPSAKNNQVTFVTAAPLTETDDEDDPKNLCKTPRAHRLVAVIQSHKDEPQSPEYLLVASVKNLCDFGDSLAQRLTQERPVKQ